MSYSEVRTNGLSGPAADILSYYVQDPPDFLSARLRRGNEMVDIHSHVLPGLDDGSPSFEVSLRMLEIAAEEGITDLVASPHADPHFRYEPERVKDLAAELSARSPAAVKLHTACDFHLAHDNVVDALAHPRRYTIAGGPYLLVELSDLVIFPNTGELYARLEDAGMIVILTHPERNPLLRQRPELIRQWVAEGRLMQLTAQSIAGRWGEKAQRFSEWMLDQGLAHFVASDAHDDERRPPRLLEARERVAARAGEPVAGLLFETHPRAAVEGAPIDLRGFPPARPPGPFWRRFFRA